MPCGRIDNSMVAQWNHLGEKGAGTSSITGQLPLENGGTEVDGTTIPANQVFAGPSSGGSGDAAFRTLVLADLPSITEAVQDIINGFILGGANITVAYNDPANTFTISVTGIIPQANGGLGVDLSALTGIISTAGGTITMLSSTGTGDVVRASTPTVTSPVINTGVSGTAVDTDTTLAANSDTKLVSQKAVKAYIQSVNNTLQNLVFLLAANNNVTGTGNFASGYLGLPMSTATLQDGFLEFDTTTEQVLIGDGVRNRVVNPIGWCPYALGIGINAAQAFTTTGYTLPANGGTGIVPIFVPGYMMLTSVSWMNVDATLARAARWDLYVQDQQTPVSGENTLRRVASSNGSDSFTATVASFRTLAASADVVLSPGLYWLALQNTQASNVYSVGFIAAGSLFSGTAAFNKFKTTSNPNGATLDFATGWTSNGSIIGVRLNGKVFGQSAVFA